MGPETKRMRAESNQETGCGGCQGCSPGREGCGTPGTTAFLECAFYRQPLFRLFKRKRRKRRKLTPKGYCIPPGPEYHERNEAVGTFSGRFEDVTLSWQEGRAFCDGLTAPRFPPGRGRRRRCRGRSAWPDLSRATASGVRAKDVNCILLFLVGGPSQLDTWDLKPDAPEHRPRPVPADPHQRARHRHLRALPADGADGRPLRHPPLGPPQGGPDPRDRPPDDADRPPVPRRQEHPHYGAVVSHLRGPRPDGVAAVRRPAARHRQHRRQRQPRPGRPARLGDGVRRAVVLREA